MELLLVQEHMNNSNLVIVLKFIFHKINFYILKFVTFYIHIYIYTYSLKRFKTKINRITQLKNIIKNYHANKITNCFIINFVFK